MAEEQIDRSGLLVKIISSEGVLYEGRVRSFSSFNKKGPFDVLPLHAHFISIIHKQIEMKLQDATKKIIKIDSGLIQVKKNYIEVFIGFQPIEAGF